MRLAFLASADISVNNGQGVYSRKILEVLVERVAQYSDERITVILPKPEFFYRVESLLTRCNPIFLSPKCDRSVLWHLSTQFRIIGILIRYRPRNLIYSIKPTLVAVPVASWVTGMRRIILVEGFGIRSLATLGGRLTQTLGALAFRMQFLGAKAVFVAYQSAKPWVESYRPGCLIEIIPCGIDERVFFPVPTTVTTLDQPITIGYVGSFRDVHRLDLLVRAAAEYHNCKLVLIGNGKEFKRIGQLVEALGLTEQVHFTGGIDQADIPKMIKACHLMWGYTDPASWGVPIKNFEFLGCHGSGYRSLQASSPTGFRPWFRPSICRICPGTFQLEKVRASPAIC